MHSTLRTSTFNALRRHERDGSSEIVSTKKNERYTVHSFFHRGPRHHSLRDCVQNSDMGPRQNDANRSRRSTTAMKTSSWAPRNLALAIFPSRFHHPLQRCPGRRVDTLEYFASRSLPPSRLAPQLLLPTSRHSFARQGISMSVYYLTRFYLSFQVRDGPAGHLYILLCLFPPVPPCF